MDVFGTVITAGGLILRFLDACSAYSDEAKSLKARFDWDMRVLQVLNDYFSQRQALKANQQLPPEDSALLEQTATYLDGFVSKVQKTLRKIERNGWLSDSIRRAMWIARRADLRDMEREMFEWTRRFNVRLLGLPPELRQIIPVASDGKVTNAPAVLRSNDRLKEFLALDHASRQIRADDMFLEDSDRLASLVTRRGDVSLQPLQYDSEQIIFASRAVPQSRIPGTQEFQRMVTALKASKADKKETWYTYVVENTPRHLQDLAGKSVAVMAAAHDEILAQTGLVPVDYHIRRKDDGTTPSTVLVVSFNQKPSRTWRLFGTSSPARLIRQKKHRNQIQRWQPARDCAPAVRCKTLPQTNANAKPAPSTTGLPTTEVLDGPLPPALVAPVTIDFVATTDRTKIFHAREGMHPDDTERRNYLYSPKHKRPAQASRRPVTPPNQPIYLRSHAKAQDAHLTASKTTSTSNAATLPRTAS